MPLGPTFGKTIAYNVVAKIGEFEDDGYTGEELKMMAEPRKILDLPDLPVVATSVRVPVIVGHGVSILAEFARPISVAEAREAIDAAPGVELCDDPAPASTRVRSTRRASTSRSSGASARSAAATNALVLFSCADNLRKGAALNAVQIAEHLFPR